jgi:quercetin dioxygenase-like cupin family protein
VKLSPTYWVTGAYAQDEANLPPAPEDSPWFARRDRVRLNPVNQSGKAFSLARVPDSGKLDTLFVFGEVSNMLVATRAAGYHSKPHVHRSEQLNYVLAGELNIFIDGVCYALKEGDFLRVPSMALHWAWNTSKGDSVLAETHSPVMNFSALYPVELVPKERLQFMTFAKSLYLDQPDPDEEAAMVAHAR